MEHPKEIIQDLFHNDKYNELPALLDLLNSLVHSNIQAVDRINSELTDPEFLEEVRNICDTSSDTTIYFGKTLTELKCVIIDYGMREHEILLHYNGPKRLSVISVPLPYSSFQDREYSSIEEVVSIFKKHADSLASYFQELDSIDQNCSVMEPVNPSFKEDYRRILLDDRIWLHVEVTPEGLGTNIHLVGQSEYWQDKLQAGLLNWDHDRTIVENIMTIFDIAEFPVSANKSVLKIESVVSENKPSTQACQTCSICLCHELPDSTGVPQPLCQNSLCGVYFHRNCLFQWLVACAGGRPPAFGVGTGSCPSCLQPISCKEKDN